MDVSSVDRTFISSANETKGNQSSQEINTTTKEICSLSLLSENAAETHGISAPPQNDKETYSENGESQGHLLIEKRQLRDESKDFQGFETTEEQKVKDNRQSKTPPPRLENVAVSDISFRSSEETKSEAHTTIASKCNFVTLPMEKISEVTVANDHKNEALSKAAQDVLVQTKILQENAIETTREKNISIVKDEQHPRTAPSSKKKSMRKTSNKKRKNNKQQQGTGVTSVSQDNLDNNCSDYIGYDSLDVSERIVSVGNPSDCIITDVDEPFRLINPLAELGPPIVNGIPTLVTPSSQKKIISTFSRGVTLNNKLSSLPIDSDDGDHDDITQHEIPNGEDLENNERSFARECDTTRASGDIDEIAISERSSFENKKRKNSAKRKGSKISDAAMTATTGAASSVTNPIAFKNNADFAQPPSSYIQLNDWLPLHDIWFCKPDTYPISFYARLLGFPLESASTTVATSEADKFSDCRHKEPFENYAHKDFNVQEHKLLQSRSNNPSSTLKQIDVSLTDSNLLANSHSSSRLLHPPSSSKSIKTELTKEQIIQTALSAANYRRTHDAIYQIPSKGVFASHIWMKDGDGRGSTTFDDDVILLGIYRDPLYRLLVHWNNTDDHNRSLILGKSLGTETNVDDKQHVTSHPVSAVQRRAGFSRRRYSDQNDSAGFYVIPISPYDHAKLQLPTGTLRELINDVYTLAVAEGRDNDSAKCCPTIQWKPSLGICPIDPNCTQSLTDPLSFLSLCEYRKKESVKDTNSALKTIDGVYYTFLTFSQARRQYPELSEDIAQVLALSSANCNSSSVSGVMDGWIALKHGKESSTGSFDEYVGVVNAEKTLVDGVHNHSDTTSMKAPSTSQSTNQQTQEHVSVAGFLVYQFAWFRDKSQAVDESELIARILEISALPQNADKQSNENTSGLFDNTAIKSPTNAALFTESNENRLVTELKLILVSLMVEYLRASNVCYAVFPARTNDEKIFLDTFFRMKSSSNYLDENDMTISGSLVMMICDIQKISSRYAMLAYRDSMKINNARSSAKDEFQQTGQGDDMAVRSEKRRWLLRLPSFNATKTAIESTASVQAEYKSVIATPNQNSNGSIKPTQTDIYSNAPKEVQNRSIQLRVRVVEPHCEHGVEEAKEGLMSKSSLGESNNSATLDVSNTAACKEKIEILRIEKDGSDGDIVKCPSFDVKNLNLNIMRNFVLPQPVNLDSDKDFLLKELLDKQAELEALEKDIEPRLIGLLSSVIDEHIAHKNDDAKRRLEENEILAKNKILSDRRKELDQARQEQLEQEMDAVCAICNDGEITPDNQILFCDACDVSVHQMCYGIEHVPDGDYFCQPCKRLNRVSRSPKSPPQPLPICCELCPLRQGAFVRTETKVVKGATSDAPDKWVHSVCAKWQGLRFVNIKKADLLEDVSEIKINFRRHGIRCELCEGEYGAMNKCMGVDDGIECDQWFHVTCARAVGTLKVIHGENCKGPVKNNPWRLMCPKHSNLSQADIPAGAISAKTLVLAAKDFPPEAKPPPPPVLPKPFNTATGKERESLLAQPEYENALITELLEKRSQGVRCEVCDVIEEEVKNLTRCSGCHVVFCIACRTLAEEQKCTNYYCPSCVYLREKKKKSVDGGEEQTTIVERPQCAVCYQQGGFLRKAYANPITKKNYWKTNVKEFEKSMFGRQLWIHAMCAL